jgi:hypothetical protein
MWLPKDVYIAKRAQEIVRTAKRETASETVLLEMGDKYRDRGIMVRPHRMSGYGERPMLERFSRQQALNQVDDALRTADPRLGLNPEIEQA